MANGKYIPKFQEGGGVSLSSLLAESAKGWAAKNIAIKDAAQRKLESTWAGIMTLLKPVAGFASKAALTGLGIGTGGLLSPLLLGLGTSGFSKIFDVAGRKLFKAGADPSKITATGKYGYGKEYATTLSEGLQESIEERDPGKLRNIATDIGMSYVSAFTPKIVQTEGGGLTIEGGELGEDVLGAIKDKDLSTLSMLDLDESGLIPEKLADIKHAKMIAEMNKLYGGDKSAAFKDVVLGDPSSIDYQAQYGTLSEALSPEFPEQSSILDQLQAVEAPPTMEFAPLRPDVPLSLEESYDMPLETGRDIEAFSEFGKYGAMEESLLQDKMFGEWESSPQSFSEELQQSMQLRNRLGFQQGGQVPSQSPTISDYFGGQGMTIGGSNIQSLSQILGRR
jgi:hypothetical protein|tara:strand:+ start:228 stop:1409 length:1182 start_codon:yes stop_codon:yes gene_type:complete